MYFWLGLLFAVGGLLMFGFTAQGYVHQRRFLARAVHVQGKIVGYTQRSVSHRFGPYTTQYTATFTFADAAGKAWEVTDQSSNEFLHPPGIGRTCKVLYNPDDPTEAQLEWPATFWYTTASPLGYAAFGALLAVTGILTVRDQFAKRKESPANGGPATPANP